MSATSSFNRLQGRHHLKTVLGEEVAPTPQVKKPHTLLQTMNPITDPLESSRLQFEVPARRTAFVNF